MSGVQSSAPPICGSCGRSLTCSASGILYHDPVLRPQLTNQLRYAKKISALHMYMTDSVLFQFRSYSFPDLIVQRHFALPLELSSSSSCHGCIIYTACSTVSNPILYVAGKREEASTSCRFSVHPGQEAGVKAQMVSIVESNNPRLK